MIIRRNDTSVLHKNRLRSRNQPTCLLSKVRGDDMVTYYVEAAISLPKGGKGTHPR